MRRLTLKGYLEKYIHSLSFNSTNSIFKLAKEIPDNFRLREPLFLYALSVGKTDILLKAVKDEKLKYQYLQMAQSYTWDDMLYALESKDDSLDREYHKIYQSYFSKRNMPETNDDTKALMYKRIRRLQISGKVSNYRIYTDLMLNPGNTNAFLKHGDTKRLSIDTIRKVLGYLETKPLVSTSSL